MTEYINSAAQPAPVVPEGWKVSVEEYGDRYGQATISGPGVFCMQVPVSYSMLDFMKALAAAPAQGHQVECQECGRLRGDFEELAERYGKLQAGEDSLLAKVVTERDQALTELSALKAHPEAYQFDGQVLRDEHGNYLAEFMAYEQSFIDRLLHPQPELKAQQVECQECERLARQVKHWQDLAVANRKVADEALAELSALKAQQMGQEPLGYLADDGGAMTAFFRSEDKDQFDAFCAEAEMQGVVK